MKKKIAILVAVCLFIAGFAVTYAQPGDENDPVITLSYITDKVIPEIYEYIDSKLSKQESNVTISDDAKFAIAEVPAGETVICDDSCEIILRAGKAKVIATEKGGLADTTAGVDLADGCDMPKNHLLIVPVDDGRGLETETDCILMIKGKYSIK